mmetsp:Transcript_8455/g.21735  ORF Transcript_8455/g.21735 Transcript_8455/m.21735 type:complete len:218 (-) Transcript_8455:648-1301(-)
MQGLNCRHRLFDRRHLNERRAILCLVAARFEHLQANNCAMLQEHCTEEEFRRAQGQALDVQVIARFHLGFRRRLGLCVADDHLPHVGHAAIQQLHRLLSLFGGGHLHERRGIERGVVGRWRQHPAAPHGAALAEEHVELFLRNVQRKALDVKIVTHSRRILAMEADAERRNCAFKWFAVELFDRGLRGLKRSHTHERRALQRVAVPQDFQLHHLPYL